MKKLLIVESPNKIKKLEHILGKGYCVGASVGHVMDLDPSKMSIEIENNFKPIYINNRDKTDVIKKLKSLANNSNEILLATDEDREGEMIAWSIQQILKLSKPKRITFNSITKKEVLDAIKNPREIDLNMVNAQKARRILDRIAGYELSPLLDKHIGQKRLSAGRVQSVAARLIVDRENEIKQFISKGLESYFKFKGNFINSKNSGKSFVTQLYDLKEKTNENVLKGPLAKIETYDKAKLFLEICTESEFRVVAVFSKKRLQSPSPPFTTASLQQESNRKFGFSAKKTMSTAQRLYEEGLITYMRTDSISLSDEAMENIKKYVIDTYGSEYYRKVEYKTKSKNAQEAHEAIRPSDINVDDISNHGGKIGSDEIKLYNLIWKRTVASQMKPAEYNVTSVQISISKDEKHYFMTNIENLFFVGYLKVYNISNSDNDDNDDNDDNGNNNDNDEQNNKNMEVPKVGTKIIPKDIIGTQEYVKPIGRFSEASLIAELDRLSISRPATLAPIIEKIKEREYVVVKDLPGIEKDCVVMKWDNNGSDLKKIEENTTKITLLKEKNKYIPTHLGIIVTNFLTMNFPKIMDYKFTANMEEKLDEIANGKLIWYDVLRDFYDEFHPLVMKIAYKNSENLEKKRLLGIYPQTGDYIYATVSKYGPVVKIEKSKGKPLYAPIKEPLTLDSINIHDALKLFEYPKELGNYERKKVLLNKGQYGYYITNGTMKCSVENEKITLNEAIELIKSKKKKSLAEFKTDSKTYTVLEGPYGKYVNVYDIKNKKKYNVSISTNEPIENLTLEKINVLIKNKWNNNQNNSKQNNSNQNNSDINSNDINKNIKINDKTIKKIGKKKIIIK